MAKHSSSVLRAEAGPGHSFRGSQKMMGTWIKTPGLDGAKIFPIKQDFSARTRSFGNQRLSLAPAPGALGS